MNRLRANDKNKGLAGTIALLLAVLLFSPLTAYASMNHLAFLSEHQIMDTSDSLFESQGSSCYTVFDRTEDDRHGAKACETDLDDTASSHGSGAICCSMMCISTIVMDAALTRDGAFADNHLSLPVFQLASTDVSGFLRPPNL
ncbi:hypothetical protein [Neptunicoccus cionae]|uniref:Uncharacterized protein n=1 Tax=Neptunicoccus cionae TaxID=2035344 RepID=A0A916VSB7_9RHOB|nr:hypothetical protein [Amylibacter cionae]GGA27705.1 hypothetical protein GCM10011498_31000 [Amylibacter cionae]